MTLLTRLAFALILVLSVCGAQDVSQVPAAPAPVIAYQPQYFIAAGAGFKQTTPQATGFLTFGVKVSDMNFTYTNLTMTSKHASVGQGFGRYIIQTDGFTLAALADAGMSTGDGSVGGAFGAGGAITKDISRFTKIPHTAFVAIIKCDKASGADVKPTFLFGLLLGLGK